MSFQTPGANGTEWHSDVWFYNPASLPTTLIVRRVAQPTRRFSYMLAPHASLKLGRVLAELGGGPGGDGITTDALVIEAPYRWGEQLTAYSRTYTQASTGGTYGQAVPALPSLTAYSTHLSEFVYYPDVPATNAQFLLDERKPGRFRHNFGAVNDLDRPVTVRLRFGSEVALPPSPPERQQEIVVAPHSVANVSIENLFTKEIIQNYPARIWVTADTPLPVWMSMVDNLSGDATFIPFTLIDILGSSAKQVVVPAVTHTPGANGTFWSTDLYGVFRNFEAGESFTLDSRATFIPRQSCGTATRIEGKLRGVAAIPSVPEDQVDPVYQSIFPDVARQFVGCTDNDSMTGALAMPRGSWMAGFTRTYTTRSSDGATFGEMLPFYPADGFPVQHFSGIEVSATNRVNIGLFNGFTDRDVRLAISIYDSGGTLAASANVTLQPGQGQQNRLSDLVGILPAGNYGLSIIPQNDGRSWAYVSLVDNVTGDPTNWW
jgi:hypothetical protein